MSISCFRVRRSCERTDGHASRSHLHRALLCPADNQASSAYRSREPPGWGCEEPPAVDAPQRSPVTGSALALPARALSRRGCPEGIMNLPKDTGVHNEAHAFFDKFLLAKSCDETLQTFQDLCQCLGLQPESVGQLRFYHNLKTRLNYWKAKALWAKLDKKAGHSTYDQAQHCAKTRCLVVGAGPCGLRTAIELALLGAKVMVVEQRKSFSRNNVLHLWPFTILDLRALGAKKYHGRFCTGTLDHISIRQLQLILLKTTLLLGVEVFVGIKFKDVVPPPAEMKNKVGKSWTALLQPSIPRLANFQFDVLVSAGGSKFVPDGFRRKELRGKLAIGITANFVNRHTAEEVKVAEISGVARIYNQTFFKNLQKQTGIDLENIVYYKDDTHYFVMTAKKQSLLKMGVILKDLPDIANLLSPDNVNSEALFKYARDAASFSTSYQLPQMEFALNHHQQPDVDMFDFTCMYRAENAAIVRERRGARLLIGLVGDCLVEPFWPLGTGVARGFLAAYDVAWMVKKWASGTPPLEVLAERESIYQHLSQTTPDNTNKNISQYSIDPASRYPNINLRAIKPNQVQHLYDTGHTERDHGKTDTKARKAMFSRKDSISVYEELLRWCRKQTTGYRGVAVTDLTHSWRSGLALCALIHHFRPHLINYDSLDQNAAVENNQLAFDLAEEELGILPILTGAEMASVSERDRLSLVTYLSQFYEIFKDVPLIPSPPSVNGVGEAKSATLSKSAILFLGKLQRTLSLKRSAKGSEDMPSEIKRKKSGSFENSEDFSPCSSSEFTDSPVSRSLSEVSDDKIIDNTQPVTPVNNGTLHKKLPSGDLSIHPSYLELVIDEQKRDNRSSTLPLQPLSTPASRGQTLKGRTLKGQTLSGSSETCYFCFQKVYILERVSAEGLFFHRGCFRCHQCDATLRLGNYVFNEDDGYFYCTSHSDDSFHPIQPQPSIYVADKATVGPDGESFSPVVEPDQGISSANKSSPALQPLDSREHSQVPLVVPDDVFEPHPTLPKSPCIVSPFVLPPLPSWSYVSKPTSPFPPDPNVWTANGAQSNDGNQSDKVSWLEKSWDKEVKDPKPGHSELMRLAKHRSRPWSAPPDTLFPPLEDDLKKSRIAKRRVLLSEVEKKELARLSLDLSLPAQPDLKELERERLMKEMNETESCESEEESTEEEDGEKEKAVVVRPRLKEVMTTAKAETLKVRSLQRRAKEDEMKRFCKAQSIQRRLEEIEEQYRVLEQMGIDLEDSLREGHDDEEQSELIDDWLHLLQDKNALVSEESDLMIAAQELELEEQQSLLELQLRSYMDLDDKVKTPKDRAEEAQTLSRMLEVVDKRNALITYLDQKRLTEINEQFSMMPGL